MDSPMRFLPTVGVGAGGTLDSAGHSPQFDAFSMNSTDAGSQRMSPTGKHGVRSHPANSPGQGQPASLVKEESESGSAEDGANGDHPLGSRKGSKGEQNNGAGGGGDPGPPAWSELKTKAGKERKRLPLACIACRRKKIRCSGEKPACKHCVRSRVPCVYKVTARKAAPRTDYMTMLDKRLKRMEERVIKIIPDAEPEKLAAVGRSCVKPGPSSSGKAGGAGAGAGAAAAASGGNVAPKKRSAEEAFKEEIEDWSKPGARSELVRLPDGEVVEDNLLTVGAEALPSREIQEHLAEIFFDYLYGQSYLLLHKPSFMRQLHAGNVPPVLMLAVCAVSARFSTHPQINTEPAFLRGESWAKPARDISLRRYDEPSITVLITLLILGLHEFGTCQGGRSYMLGGMAMRMAHALQLHRELEHDPAGASEGDNPSEEAPSKLSFTDREIRRRTMWACFMMDRFNSSGTERPMTAHEESIEVQLPIKESNFIMEIPGPTETLDGDVVSEIKSETGVVTDPRENMGVAAYLVRIITIWGRVVKYFNLGGKRNDRCPIWHVESQYGDLKKQVSHFESNLPDRLRFNKENLQNHAAEGLANQFLFMHISYQQVVLFLNRFAIPAYPGKKQQPGMPKAFSQQAAKAALNAATRISELLAEPTAQLVVAPFAGFCAFVSSTIHVWGIFSKVPQVEASCRRHLITNVKYLDRMKKHWGVLHHMANNLRNIFQLHADAARRGNKQRPGTSGEDKDGNSGEPEIFEYGNWFQQYPHGVSASDWEDPVAEEKKDSGNEAVMAVKPDLKTVEEFFRSLTPPAPPRRKSRVGNSVTEGGGREKPTSSLKRESSNSKSGHGAKQGSATSPTKRRNLQQQQETTSSANVQTMAPQPQRALHSAASLERSMAQQSQPRQQQPQQQFQGHSPPSAGGAHRTSFDSPTASHQMHTPQHTPLDAAFPTTTPPLFAQRFTPGQPGPGSISVAGTGSPHSPFDAHPPQGPAPTTHHHQQQQQHNPHNPQHQMQSFFGGGMPVSVHNMDRQFVFDAYAADPAVSMGVWNMNAVGSGGGGGGGGNGGGGSGGDDFTGLGDVGFGGGDGDRQAEAEMMQQLMGGEGLPGEGGSSAWFTPFNMAPPDVGEYGSF